MRKQFLASITLVIASPLWAAGNLKNPIGLSSSRVLPQNIRNFSYKSVYVSATDKYNSNGNTVVVADPFFKNLTFGDLIDGKKDGKDKGSIEEKMRSVGANEDTKFAETVGQVNVEAVANVPVLAWGITSKMTMAIAVPVVNSSINVDTGVKHTDTKLMNNFAQAIRDAGDELKAQEFEHKMQQPIRSKVEEYGYRPLVSENDTKLGDIKLVAKQLLDDSDNYTSALQLSLTLPTGEQADVDKVVDVAGGDGQTDIGLGMGVDLHLTQELDLLVFAEHTVQLEDETKMRIPERSDSKLSPDKDNNTKRDLGDITLASVGLKYKFINGFNLGTAYSYQEKAKDQYSGNKYRGQRYNWLETETASRLQTMQVTVGYDTIALFRQKKFPAPISAAINYSRPVDGKNVIKDPSWTLDLALFF